MTIHRTALSALIAFGSILVAPPALAELINCSEGGAGQGSCENGEFLFANEPGEGNTAGTCSLECWSMLRPPPTPTITCMSDGLEHYCEVWPRSPFFTYIWEYSGPFLMTLPQHSTFPFQRLSCQRHPAEGTVNVSIISSWGQRSSDSARIHCQEVLVNQTPSPNLPTPPVPVLH